VNFEWNRSAVLASYVLRAEQKELNILRQPPVAE
jgi:hypothetical protein